MASKKGHAYYHSEEDKPPVFKRWRSWYILVLGALVTYMILLYAFTKLYA